MRSSLWLKLFIGLTIFLLLTFSLMIFLNTKFLEDYYLREKSKAISKFADEVESKFNGSISDIEDMLLEAEHQLVGNVNIFDSAGRLAYTTNSMNTKKNMRLPPFNSRSFKNRIAKSMQDDKSLFFPYENSLLNMKSYVLIKPLSEGYYMIVISPIEQIQESIGIMNRFNYFTMSIALIIGLALALIYAKQFTKPITELNSIAKDMINLDFNRKYESNSKDEISQLGDTINTLSEKLDTTINDLNDANHKLKLDIIIKKRNEEQRKELVSNISHELKTPIALIQGYGEGLRDSVITTPDDMNFYCDVIIDEAKKMNKLVMELLDLSHLESGQYKLDKSDFSIDSLTKHIISKYKDVIAKKDIELSFNLNSDDEIFINADINRIEQVIKNLLNNGIDHVDENRKIDISIDQTSSGFKFSLFNSGKNIPDEIAENIWGSFYKADKARTRDFGGTGLGLTVTKGILNLHEYKYGLENKPNGVVFWFST